ncbi:MAG: hypothetical protein MUP45_04275 [Candidatus Marinimicrobia bacterium]|nr:hypothetical protein [Candidatus Neomarinimicrobiota bacterium]
MKKKDKGLQTIKKRGLNPKNIAELRKDIDSLINTPPYGADAIFESYFEKQQVDRDKPESFRQLMNLGSLDSFRGITEIVDQEYKGRVTEFATRLYQEYDCKTPAEKALAQTVVVAFERILQLTGAFNRILKKDDQTNDFFVILNKRLQILGMEIDRANRHFLTALQTLKQIKAPQLEVNVKTKTAFVAQNQQFNVGNKPAEEREEDKNEIIEAK